MNTRIQTLFESHHHHFGSDQRELRLFRAPGRVNLIGEHTDYNDGFVFPVAIDRDFLMAVSPRNDRLVRIHALDFDTTITFHLDHLEERPKESWGIYPYGVAAVLTEQSDNLCGIDAVLQSTVPIGAGLSSSAALEMVVATMWNLMAGLDISGPALARSCQRAENEYAGVQCGIMDQFISCLAQSGAALLIDCRSLDYESVPIQAPDHVLIITNTNKPRELADSAYNERRQQCEEGVRILKLQDERISALRDLSIKQFTAQRETLPRVVRDRCEHVIAENQRVFDSVQALKEDDLSLFGQLMNDSHDSLRDLYEVSCHELDFLVQIARETSGVLGSRMTGGGFGGCTVSLVEKDKIDRFEKAVWAKYPSETGYEPDIYVCEPTAGAEEVLL
jgi:galactokinase